MKVTPTNIPDVLIIEPKVFGDARGFVYESFNLRRFFELTGIRPTFVQDNHTISVKCVLHGLHYQIRQAQGKLVRVVAGEVFDVAVDLRKTSPTFGCWTSTTLSAENKLQMWIPAGFAHGFLVLSDAAEVLYKVTDYYAPEHECSILWNDSDIGIDWPIEHQPSLSTKDQQGFLLRDAETF
jgi:dTDP-4-dehydrorhamnose 3,5-epimerase